MGAHAGCSRNCTAAAGISNKSDCGRELWSRYTSAIAKYRTLRGKQMVYSVIGNLAPGRGNPVWKWAAETGFKTLGNSWRTNIDIQGGFSSVCSIVNCQRRLSGNGSWCPNDPDDPSGPGFPCESPNCNGKECPGPEYYAGPGHWNDMGTAPLVPLMPCNSAAEMSDCTASLHYSVFLRCFSHCADFAADMLIIGTRTNLAPPFCANCTCGPGRDPETGRPICTGCDGCARPKVWKELNLGQCRAHMSMWTILKSPLLASADLLTVNQSIIDVLTNTEVLAVSDDPLGKEGVRLGDSGRQDKSIGEIYVGPMEHGKFAVVMFNRQSSRPGTSNVSMTFQESDLHSLMLSSTIAPGASKGNPKANPQGKGWRIRDLWQHTDNGTLPVGGVMTVEVPAADAVMFTLSPLA